MGRRAVRPLVPCLLVAALCAWAWRTRGETADPAEASADRRSHVLSVQGDRFLLDRRPLDLWGIRVASATKDAQVTGHLIAQLDDYKAHGVNTVAVYWCGSSAGNYDPFSSDGTAIEAGHLERMERILLACDAREMVAVVGLFYQNAPFGLRDADAVRNAVRTVTRSLRPYRNVVINIANEQNSSGWSKAARVWDFRDVNRILELCRLVHEEDPQRLVGGGGYDHEKNKRIGRSPDVDVLLFDTSGPGRDSGQLYDEFVAAGVVNKPIVNVELFGGWTKNFRPPGVFPDEVKRAYAKEVEAAASRPGLSVFFHNNPWCQGPSVGATIRYDLGGQGTKDDPGIRWYFEYVRAKRGLKP